MIVHRNVKLAASKQTTNNAHRTFRINLIPAQSTIKAPELADMVMRGEVKLSPQQMRAMIELLPFHAPKLHSVGVGYLKGEDFPSRLDRAIEASNKAKVIEARAINSEQD